ncbi:ABC transporter substrate-binding protein [Bradyrhizobium sp. B097]|uniref:ABC transporter substrate-binding protein n=1 Tax=Bradyrhizobium sp. B097 TaxID=3140244 RepID=UPI0031842C8C
MLNERYASAASTVLLFCALTSTARASDIHIAVVSPISGSSDASGALMRGGAAAAVETLNRSGLLPDTKVTLSIADDACAPKQAVAVPNELTTDQVRLGRWSFLFRFFDPRLRRLRRSGHDSRITRLDKSSAARTWL